MFFAIVGATLAVLLVIGAIIDRLDRKRGRKGGMIRPRGRRARVDDARWMGNDLSTFDPRAKPDDKA